MSNFMVCSQDDQTIVAQCTPQGSGAIALLRITGTNAVELTDKLAQLSHNKRLTTLPTHTIHYGWVVNTEKQLIDQVMFLLMRAPKTFTGQDTVEITCHNNQFLIQDIINTLIHHGARLAQAGEFSKRSVLNNKIDLIQAEAINELIHANTQQALKQSLSQLQGSFSHWVRAIEKDLIKALVFSESSFEFIDDELEFGDRIDTIVAITLEHIKKIRKQFDQQKQIREGIRVALVGSVNAGKSSLFNALLDHERAIVTNIAGTTRDSIEAGVYTDATYWTLVDTAGLRQTDNIIEQKGIEKSFAEAKKADILLLIFDRSRPLTDQEYEIYSELATVYQDKIIVIHNKSDLTPAVLPKRFTNKHAIVTSSMTNHNITAVKKAITHKIDRLYNAQDLPFLLNQRQFGLISTLEKELLSIKQMLCQPIQYELLSIHLQEAISQVSELTGKTISEQAMDALFKEFCVGK